MQFTQYLRENNKHILFIFTGACECNLQVVHPTTAQPVTCEIHPSCLSATCYANTSNLLGAQQPSSQAQHSITFELQPCTDLVHLVLAGSLPDRDFRGVRVQGLGRIPIEDTEGVDAGSTQYQLHVPHWNLSSSTLQFGIEVCIL